MTEVSVIPAGSMLECSPLRVRIRWAFHQARATVLPRRWVIPLEMRDNRRHFAHSIAEARARNASRDEVDALEAEAAHFCWELEEEREMLESRRLLARASKYMLTTPELPVYDPNYSEDDPNWHRGTTFKPDWYLRRNAMQDLRSKIRAEKKARLEPISESVKLMGAIIGGAGGAAYLVEKLIHLMHP